MLGAELASVHGDAMTAVALVNGTCFRSSRQRTAGAPVKRNLLPFISTIGPLVLPSTELASVHGDALAAGS